MPKTNRARTAYMLEGFWAGFWLLPQIYIMIWLGFAQFGVLFVVWELAHRKLTINKEGVTFDRLSTRRGAFWHWIVNRNKKRKRKSTSQSNSK